MGALAHLEHLTALCYDEALMRRLALITLLLAVAAVAIMFFMRTRRDPWKSVELPQMLQRDGNRANVVLADRRRKLIGLAAIGVTWSPDISMTPEPDGWLVNVSAADRAAQLQMGGDGPSLLVALPGMPAERFALSPAGFDSLVAALKNAQTADTSAPLDSPSVVDVVRDAYSGPDRQRLLQLLAQYKTIVLTPAEREALSRRPGGG
jgi:hypothetical protein